MLHPVGRRLLLPKKALPFWEPYNFYGTEEMTVVKHAGGMFYRAILDGAAEPAIYEIPMGDFSLYCRP